ncbi:DUF484 family protein [Oxalicibacterium solurbis]|uniref:DUF484 family protein n=1 Tax=Oxalicibacterium solurbis TaxID=69280 RepID=A0A8J3B2P7_9BURK|nr:DUF484 family protein [Oxalicibacterium solurbis]GGI53805.1 hypothetical protein GCM10011430_09790 [Oxalicibacterium solurbis]
MDSNAVADYLLANPKFFEEHAELLSQVRLSSVLGGRTLSLQERQMDVLREKLKVMELRMAELMRIGQENDRITHHFQAWTRDLLLARNDVDLPHTLATGLQNIFGVPHVTLRLWGVAEEFAHAWFAAAVSDDVRLFTNSLSAPFCGPNNDFEAVTWLEDAPAIQSVALLPLRLDGTSEAFGLLVLGSPDADRFTADMGTDFLSNIAQTAAAALAGLID